MKIAYIAHPVGGDVKRNIAKIIAICREINLTEPNTVPFVPYLSDLYALDDDNKAERIRGIANDIAVLKSGMVNEIRLYGNTISNGMAAEIKLANELGIMVIPMTPETKSQLPNVSLF